MPDLDFARFQLSAIKAAAEIRIDFMKAVAEYNAKMVEIAKKQVEVEVAQEKLEILRDARGEYAAALRESKRELRKMERSLAKVTRHATNAARLEWGELIAPSLLTLSWAGFVATLKGMEGPPRREIMRMRISSDHRRGIHFIKPRFPNKECEDAPGNVRTAVSLFGWAKKKQYIPVSASPPYETLLSVFDAMDVAGSAQISASTTKITELRQQLLRLRQMNWKAVDIGDFPAA